ncbi:MAG: helix-turn-helix domain-containing protein [Saprospiraceae bacterium]
MLFYFNQWSALLLPFFLQGILFTILLLQRGIREERLPDKILALLILIFTLRIANWMLGFANWYDAHDWHSTFMFYFPFTHWFLIGPLVYFYFRSLTNHNFHFQKKDFIHFIPAIIDFALIVLVFILDVIISYWWRGEPFPYHFGTQGKWRMEGIPGVDAILTIGAVISLLFYFFITIKSYRQYRNYYINQHFSDPEKVQFNWLGNFLYAMIIAAAIWFIFMIINELSTDPLDYIQNWYAYFAWGIILYYISISGYYTRPELSLQLQFEPEQVEKPEPEVSVNEVFKTKLLHIMEVQQPFLQAELTLQELADLLKIPPNTLSKLINSDFNQNFNDFINAYRVEAVKQKLFDPRLQHLSILGIAFESGFNSKATFNRAFRKHAGVSPTEFVAAQKIKRVSN